MALASGNLLPLKPSVSSHPAIGEPQADLRWRLSASFRPRCQFSDGSSSRSKKSVGSVVMALMVEGKLGGRGGGAAVLERPGLDQSTPDTAPRTEEGGEMGKSSQSIRLGNGDKYRVLLLDHERHTESQVAKVIPRVVPSVSPDTARKCFYESREIGFALVTIAVKEHAEFYVQMLTRYGLRSTMEQDSSVA